jgi:phosphate transport system substrate-binding protein
MTRSFRPNRASRTAGSVRFAWLAAAALAAATALAACGSTASGAPSSTAASGSTSPSSTVAPSSPASALAALESFPSSSMTIQENGSSLLAPLFAAWATGIHQAHSGITINTGDAGSGTGISDAISGTIDIGASDAYLPASEMTTVENIPLAISAQQINFNLPGLNSDHLKFNAKVLNGIYAGTITKWNAPAITALNPGVKLPNLTISPLHRSDSSGDTFLFTSFLNAGDPSGWVAKQGPSTSVTFPNAPNAQGEVKNSGMLAGCKQIKGCIAYIGISYLQKTKAAGLGEAMLQNRSGAYELPTPATINAEAASFTNVPANGALSLIYGPAATGYPIINFEYAIVKPSQPSASKAQAIKAILAWAMDATHGSSSSYLSAVNFQQLPAGALSVAVSLLKKIS